MNPLTLEWVGKVEGDLFTARREYRVRKSPNYDAVCFHTQQAVEKYMKAVLQEWGITIPRIHSLADLLALISKRDASFMTIQADAAVLEGYAVQFRLQLNGVPKGKIKEQGKNLLSSVGITEEKFKRYPANLSGGSSSGLPSPVPLRQVPVFC